MESLKRLVGVLLAPTETFRKLAERPTWAVALIVLVALTATVGTVANQKIDPDAQREQMRTMFEERQGLRGDELDESVDQAMEMTERFGWIGGVVAMFLITAIFLIAALFFLVGTNLIGGELGFVRSLATTVHGMMPHAVGQLIALPILLASGPLDPGVAQRGEFLRSNLAFLAPEDASVVVTGLLSGLDLFALWSVVLVAIGLSVVGRLSKGAAAALSIGWWAIGTSLRIAFLAMFT